MDDDSFVAWSLLCPKIASVDPPWGFVYMGMPDMVNRTDWWFNNTETWFFSAASLPSFSASEFTMVDTCSKLPTSQNHSHEAWNYEPSYRIYLQGISVCKHTCIYTHYRRLSLFCGCWTRVDFLFSICFKLTMKLLNLSQGESQLRPMGELAVQLLSVSHGRWSGLHHWKRLSWGDSKVDGTSDVLEWG